MTADPSPTHSLGHYQLPGTAEKHQCMYTQQVVDASPLQQADTEQVKLCLHSPLPLFLPLALNRIQLLLLKPLIALFGLPLALLAIILNSKGNDTGRAYTAYMGKKITSLDHAHCSHYKNTHTHIIAYYWITQNEIKENGDHVLQHFLSAFDFKSTLSLLWSGPTA